MLDLATPLREEAEPAPAEAPKELLLVGDPKLGCDAWQWPQPVEMEWLTGIEAGLVTEPVRYIRADLAEAALSLEKQRAAGLLAEMVAGITPSGAESTDKLFQQFLRGANSVHDTNLRWARWKAHEMGLTWPLPKADFLYGRTNEDGSTLE